MSDAQHKELSDKLDKVLAALKGGASTGGATNTKTPGATTPPKTGATTPPKPANKPATAPPKPAAGATKAPGGKHNAEEVREIIRKVANNANLGKQSARDILDTDGGGVSIVSDLKPEFFDAVFEACQVALSGEGGGGEAADNFDPTA